MTNRLRPPAIPLITHDPYFSVWSFTDKLYDDTTRHWTGTENSMCGIAFIDQQAYLFCGRCPAGLAHPIPTMAQTNFCMSALSTAYVFAAAGIELRVQFTSPLLLNSLTQLSTPVSYLDFKVRSMDNAPHSVSVYFDISAQLCIDIQNQSITGTMRQLAEADAMVMGNIKQDSLSSCGDDKRIDWGYVYFLVPRSLNADTMFLTEPQKVQLIEQRSFLRKTSIGPMRVEYAKPAAAAIVDLDCIAKGDEKEFFLAIAYDDIDSIAYFGQKLPPYWKKDGLILDEMLSRAIARKNEIIQQCRDFDQDLARQGLQCGGPLYTDLLILSYRQAVAGHKLVYDEKDGLLFFSKECFSNGCIATCDISYPSMPLFLIYNPTLVCGMLKPIFHYAERGGWPYRFAPHDVGQYPLANGQVYGLEEGKLLLEKQMPVEECGNMLIMSCAYADVSGDWGFIEEHFPMLKQWADYLMEKGMNPEEQLCTDDFAGHLAHNCNLSIKGIIGLGCFEKMCDMLKKEVAGIYGKCARSMAAQWIERAHSGTHTQLTFDDRDSWSIKYNLIWDDLLTLNLFPNELKEREAAWYVSMQNAYGVPLDNRADYSKVDWIVWAASLTSDQAVFDKLITPLWRFVNETPSRVPLSDWYDTKTGEMITYLADEGKKIGFTARTVVGGVFIKLLKSMKEMG